MENVDEFTCTIDDIGYVLSEKILDPYNEFTRQAVKRGIKKTMKRMVKRTKHDEPPIDGGKWLPAFHPHRDGGTFVGHISHKGRDSIDGFSETWYVRDPEYRLTHLLAKGHHLFIFGRNANKDTKPNDWLLKARDEAAGEVEKDIMKELNKA